MTLLARAAAVIPFPATRRVHFVRRHAARMASLTPQAADNYLASQLKIQRDALERKGVAPSLVDDQMRALTAAIRAALWHIVLTPGGAA